jgi:hypothetical protein
MKKCEGSDFKMSPSTCENDALKDDHRCYSCKKMDDDYEFKCDLEIVNAKANR